MSEMTARDEMDVVEITHDNCGVCAALIDSAVVHALGSTGATMIEDRTRVGGTIHSVTVVRARCRWAGTDCLCPVCRAAHAEVAP